MTERTQDPSGTRRIGMAKVLAIALTSAAVTAGIVALLVNIFERKQEARYPFFRVVDLSEENVDPQVWGKNFPHQYDQYSRTVDQKRTRFGGSEAVPRTPTEADPRSIVAQSRLEEDPRLVTFWAGYAFSKDFNEERGHAYMLLDQRLTGRQQAAQQPGACLHCHASTYDLYRTLGKGDLEAGFHEVNAMTYADATKLVEHPVACIDCHDPETMQLRVTRPAFMRGIQRYKASQGIAGYEVNRDATRQEMRAFVCGQCHVEYYFEAPKKTLTYPWANGLQVDDILAYYDQLEFKDWTHERSGAPALKAQHPEFEMWNQGTHARAGVTCADCHMPYMRVGAYKVSDHHVRSPLLNISNACQTCHNVPESELAARAYTIQSKTFQMRNLAMDAVIALITDIEKAQKDGAPAERLAASRYAQRRAQFFTDFIEAENSMGFHADQEAMRVLALAVDAARSGQILLRDPSHVPSWSTSKPAVPAVGAADAPASESEASSERSSSSGPPPAARE